MRRKKGRGMRTMARLTDLPNIGPKLAENLDQFDFMARPLTQETDIALTELGCVAYHGSVTLEELMRDNPAEQHQQEMGGLA